MAEQENKINILESKLDLLIEKVDKLSNDFLVVSADIQASTEALCSQVITFTALRDGKSEIKEVNDTPGVKADGTLTESIDNEVNNVPEVKKDPTTLNIKEFFKYMFTTDTQFEEEFTTEEGKTKFHEYMKKPVAAKKKQPELDKARALSHYTTLSSDQKKKLRQIQNEMKEDKELKIKKETPTLNKDD